MFCSCASVQLEIHRPENTNKITDVRALTCTIYLTFTTSLYDGKYACFHMGVVRSISRLIHGIARQMGASNREGFWVVDIYRIGLSFVSPSL